MKNNPTTTAQVEIKNSPKSPDYKWAIPPEIQAKNHRRAYALGFKAGWEGRKLSFVSPIVRNSIVRGYLTAERERAYADAIIMTAAAL